MNFSDTIYHFYTPFNHNSDKIQFYTCTIFEIDGKRRDSKGFNTHLEEKCDEDVKVVRFVRTKNFKKIPSEISEIFKNFEILIIEDCKLSELKRENCHGLQNLKEFFVIHSQIKFLPGNIFDDLKSLECFGFIDSEIATIEENVVDNLTNLKAIYLVQSPVINAVYVEKESLYQFPPVHQFGEVTKVPSIPEMSRLIKNCSPCSSVCSDLKNLLSRESFKDFTITIKNSSFHGSDCTQKCCNEIFKIHKFLLVARSQTFSDMISTLPEVRNLNLVDISSHAFKKVLDYLYDGVLPKSDQHLKMKDVFMVANKLGLRELKEYSKIEMIKNGCFVMREDNSMANVEDQAQIEVDPVFEEEISTSNENVEEEKFSPQQTEEKSQSESTKEIDEEFDEFVKITKDLNADQFEFIDDFYDEVCEFSFKN